MAVCTFFGHRDCPSSIRVNLRETLVYLIKHKNVDLFYVGNQGAFDTMVRTVLRELVSEYPHICYAVVLAYLPQRQSTFDAHCNSDTILPEGIELIHKRFAVHWRNKWMLRQSDYVVTYITHSWGGAAQFVEMAARQKKQIISLV